MKAEELRKIEAELEQRGYRKSTGETNDDCAWCWYKYFGEKRIGAGGWLVMFRVWDGSKYYRGTPDTAYGFGFVTMPTSIHMIRFESNWDPICDIDAFERMAAEFNAIVRKYANLTN